MEWEYCYRRDKNLISELSKDQNNQLTEITWELAHQKWMFEYTQLMTQKLMLLFFLIGDSLEAVLQNYRQLQTKCKPTGSGPICIV